jgi:drug/metabolite transporter (DMT)-like permease
MTVFLSLVAALGFALGNVLQQKGTLETEAPEGDPHFLAQVLRRPIWIAGGLCQVAGWILQAVALKSGSLVVVQSLTSISLVMALPLGAKITDQQITRRVTAGAMAMVVGIVLLLAVGSPQGGTTNPSASAWISAGLVSVLIVGVLYRMGRERTGAAKALLFGSAAGIAFGLQAAVTKVFMELVGKGLGTILTSWTIYVLMASAIVGFVLQQSALKTGILAPAMASSNAVTLIASVLLGVSVFGESVSSNDARSTPAVLGLLIALVGIVLLAGANPPQSAHPMPDFDEVSPDPGGSDRPPAAPRGT